MQSSTFDGMSGQPNGPPEWPLPGGMLNQDGKLVDAVELLRAEWTHLRRGEEKATPAKASPRPRRAMRRRR